MPLHINLLHEEHSKSVERKRDPLKIGVLTLLMLGFALYGYYVQQSYQAGKVSREKAELDTQLAKISPKAAQAKNDGANASLAMASTVAIEKIINERFYWGPLFSDIVGGTGPEIQLTSFDGVLREPGSLTFTVTGISAGHEPRAVAEKFRQNMEQRLRKTYGGVSSQFASLENNETPLLLDGKSVATANFSIGYKLTFPLK